MPLLPHPHPDSWASAIEQTTPLPDITSPGRPRISHRAAVPSHVAWCGFGLVPFLLLLFPNGRLVSRRWRTAMWLSGLALFVLVFGLAFTPRQVHDDAPAPIDNPVGIEILRNNSYLGDEGVGWLLFPLALVVATASYISRFRRSTGIERVQLKWFALAGGVVVVSWLALMATWQSEYAGVAIAFVVAAMLSLPVAAGIAILRHRLYDIDLIINRTLVYGALTVVLALCYSVGVTIFKVLLNPFTGDSQIAVAGSTLAVAALFGPARSRIQDLIDSRFYRTKYDAGKTLDHFAGRLREEVDIDALTSELLTVVSATMHPRHVTLWLASANGSPALSRETPIRQNHREARKAEGAVPGETTNIPCSETA